MLVSGRVYLGLLRYNGINETHGVHHVSSSQCGPGGLPIFAVGDVLASTFL